MPGDCIYANPLEYHPLSRVQCLTCAYLTTSTRLASAKVPSLAPDSRWRTESINLQPVTNWHDNWQWLPTSSFCFLKDDCASPQGHNNGIRGPESSVHDPLPWSCNSVAYSVALDTTNALISQAADVTAAEDPTKDIVYKAASTFFGALF